LGGFDGSSTEGTSIDGISNDGSSTDGTSIDGSGTVPHAANPNVAAIASATNQAMRRRRPELTDKWVAS
jgi:hypothetical protein